MRSEVHFVQENARTPPGGSRSRVDRIQDPPPSGRLCSHVQTQRHGVPALPSRRGSRPATPTGDLRSGFFPSWQINGPDALASGHVLDLRPPPAACPRCAQPSVAKAWLRVDLLLLDARTREPPGRCSPPASRPRSPPPPVASRPNPRRHRTPSAYLWLVPPVTFPLRGHAHVSLDLLLCV